MASPAVSSQASAVGSMSINDKLLEAIRRSQKCMPAEAWQQVKQLMSPEAISVMAAVTAAWAVSHFFGVGEIADAVLLVVGGIALGASAIEAGKEAVDFALAASGATKDEDFEVAAKHLGRAVVLGGVALISALFLRARPKVMNEMRFGGPVTPATGPGPRTGGLFYKPKVTVGPIKQRPGFFTKGITNQWGDIVIEASLSKTEQATVLLHEKIHALLTPRFYFLRNVRVRLGMEGYNRSYLLRYLEEALAQATALLRTKGLAGGIEAMCFPVRNGYVTVAKMGQEVAGILLGPVNVGGTGYLVYFNAKRPQ